MFDDRFREIFASMAKDLQREFLRPRPVCSCEVPDYAEDLFDLGMFRFRCGTCRGYIDLLWIHEGYFPEPPKEEAPVQQEPKLRGETEVWKLSDEWGVLTEASLKSLGVSETFLKSDDDGSSNAD